MLHIGTNDAPFLTSENMFKELKELRDFILNFLPNVKLIFSTPVIRTDKSNANENNKTFINCLKKAKFDCIHHTNITKDHLNAYGLHINGYSTRVLAKKLVSGTHAMWREKDSLIKIGKLKYKKSKFTSASAEDKVEDSCNTFLTELNTEPCETTTENESDINLVLRKLHVSYLNNVIIGHLNITFIRKKFEMLQFLLADYIDVFMISESKLDGTFSSSQFQTYGFRTLYRLDRKDRWGGILLFVRENLMTRLLSRHSFPHDTEILFIELNLRKKKQLICWCYNPHKNLINYHL